ncbi:uncharacterized protein K441DRAFT_658387 [Cenococcum geophilum 1.58]|uniref:uncharacterized protein n=1 Tax=Cenococcum geophilum 1.58 TaxID=794803 RepID=UPI00358F3859|nr:hypothetical protein K441DRAFT_658387 [Cenococcum geophilum 1.58]
MPSRARNAKTVPPLQSFLASRKAEALGRRPQLPAASQNLSVRTLLINKTMCSITDAHAFMYQVCS